MMQDDRNQELRARFAELRARDHGQAPDFDSAAPAQPSRTTHRRYWHIGLAAAAASALWLAARALQPEPLPAPVPLTYPWHTPTDALLPAQLDQLLRELPRLDESIIDRFIDPQRSEPGGQP